MSALNMKIFGALLIFFLSLTEFIVYNEEVFLFVCFFIFFNAVASAGGKAVGGTFESLGFDFEKDFVQSSQEAKEGILCLISSKKTALNTISNVILLLQTFKAVALQKSLLFILNSFVQTTKFYLNALSALSLSSSQRGLSQSSDLIFSIVGKKNISTFFSPYKHNVGVFLSIAKSLNQ